MKNSNLPLLKNQQLLVDNGFVFDPFNNFPLDIDLARAEQFEAKSYREIFTVLRATKDSMERLTDEQQAERNVITLGLFNKIIKAEVNPIAVDAPLLAQHDEGEVRKLADKIANPTFHEPMCNEFFKVIPSRYQRRARQLLLMTGHFVHVNRATYIAVCETQGETLELQAYQFLDALQARHDMAA